MVWKDMTSSELSHYDAIASTFLSVGATMIAIIASLLPIVRVQHSINERTSVLFGISSILLVFVIMLSVLGLLAKNTSERKRTLCVLPAVPLMLSIVLLMLTLL
jgi:uncharacterized membrane protein